MSQSAGVERATASETATGHGNGTCASAGRTVRDAAFEVMRRHGLTTIFGNPGSTEIAFLTDLPADIAFVLGLHEGSVVGMATGYAMARGEPAFVNLHTAAGLGNAINAIANARDCRAPLVIVVGQQDRRQIAFEPFLTGRALERLAGEYPVWRHLPSRAAGRAGRDRPRLPRGRSARTRPGARRGADGRLARAGRRARRRRAREGHRVRTPWPARRWRSSPICWPSCRGAGAGRGQRPRRRGLGRRRGAGRAARAARCGRSRSAVASVFPRTTRCSPGICTGSAGCMHDVLARYDVVLTVGTNAFRAYLFDEPVALVEPGTRVAVLDGGPRRGAPQPV